MSVSGGCEICQTGDVAATCDRCGSLVCERHFDGEVGLCVECVVEVGGGDANRQQRGEYPDGVEEFRF